MKRYQTLLTVLFILSGAIWASADFYVVDQDNKIVSKTKYRPSQADLDLRGEIAVEVNEEITLMEAEYRGGKVVKHKKTAEELGKEKKHKDTRDEMSLIHNKMKHMACLALESDGVNFKGIKCSDFE